MSVNVLIFDKSKAPTAPKEFLEWFLEKGKWDPERDYFGTEGTSKPLVDLYLELVKEFPPMNGEYAPSEEDFEKDPGLEERLIDYTIDDDLIYLGIPFSCDDSVFDRVTELTFKYGLGYYDMVNIYLDKDTVINVQEISPGKQNGNERTRGKGLLARIFGKR